MEVEARRFRETVDQAFGPIVTRMGFTGPSPELGQYGCQCRFWRSAIALVVSHWVCHCEFDVSVEWREMGASRLPRCTLYEVAWALLDRDDVCAPYMAGASDSHRCAAGIDYLSTMTGEVLPSVLPDPDRALRRIQSRWAARRAEEGKRWLEERTRREAGKPGGSRDFADTCSCASG